MAWNFADQIHALTGFDADNTSDSETGEDFNLLANQWLVDADSGYHVGCREVNPIYGGSASDSTSIHAASSTDPVYWIESDTGGDPKLFVKPDPSSDQPARVHYLSYPPNSTVWDGSNLPGAATSISNFPDELEYLVPLRASITALEYQVTSEEDPELYLPLIQNLKQDYQQGLQMLGVGQAQPQQGAR
jgi:hypothetical protein